MVVPLEVLLLVKIVLAILDCFFLFSFVFPHEVENCSFKICEELCCNFEENYIESVDCVW